MSSIFVEGKNFSEKKSDEETQHWLESNLKWERTSLSPPITEIHTLAVT